MYGPGQLHTDSLTHDRNASLTPPNHLHHKQSLITYYNQQIQLAYTTTPVLGNESPSGYDNCRVSLLHTGKHTGNISWNMITTLSTQSHDGSVSDTNHAVVSYANRAVVSDTATV